MHATIAFSKKAFDHGDLHPLDNTIKVIRGPRSVIPLGEKGATVLRFESPDFRKRWQEIVDHGASWEHDGYHPHVSITYSSPGLDLDEIEPFTGPLIFGPEIFAPVVLDWDKKISEIPTDGSKDGVLEGNSFRPVKYRASILENTIMTESLASMLMKNIDLIMEAFNVDDEGNLIEVNKKKVAESDEIFHDYFVKHMNRMYRNLNENDPLVMEPNAMHQPGVDHGMHAMGHPGMHQPHGMGMGDDGMNNEMGTGGDMHLGDMAMDDMHMHGGHQMNTGFDPNQQFEGVEPDEYATLFGENTDLEINELFGLTEDDQEEEAEHDEGEEHLNEFMDETGGGQADFLPDGGMDDGGANDFGGDMGGMDLDSGMDHHDMDDGMGGDMITIHGQTDNGGDFEFSFDKDALDFDGMGGGSDDDAGGGDMDDMNGPDGAEHGMDQPGMGDHEDGEQMGEAAEHFHNGKPGKGAKGPRTSRMGVVPANPKANHAAPFPSAMGQRQKKK